MVVYEPAIIQDNSGIISMVPAGDASGAVGIAVGKDAIHDPWAGLRSYQRGRPFRKSIAGIFWTQSMVLPEELWQASFTPKGSFLTWVVGKNVISNGWNFVKEKKAKDPIEGSDHELLVKLTKQFKIKKTATLAIQVGRILGRALAFLWQKGGKGKTKQTVLRVTYIPEQYIYYDEESGEVLEYTPFIKIGRTWRNISIKPENAVLFVNDRDPFGNENDGISSLLSSYRTLLREENISEGYTTIITQRGLGLLDVTVKGVKNEAELVAWHKKYGNPSNFSAMFHNERLTVNAIDGMRAGYNYDDTLGRMTKSVSSASGFPGMRMEGVQTGAVTGSETDQDNTAENYRGIQETHEDNIIALYHLVDRSTRDIEFELDFPFDIKMDRAKISQIFGQNIQSIVTLPELLTVNQALEMLELKTFDTPEGDLYVIEFMKKNRIGAQEKFPSIEEEVPEDEEIKEGEVEPNKPITKKGVAKQMIRTNLSKDSDSQIGWRKMNDQLKVIFGSGMSPNYWSNFRKEVKEEMML